MTDRTDDPTPKTDATTGTANEAATSPHPGTPLAAAADARADDVDVDALRQLFLDFFEARGHLVYPSASLESDDPTLMFTSAGMVQFKPYFLGATPKFAGYDGIHHRVATAQKCLRINDIENVGRTLRHHSFFEMLGNFSFGDYFKSDAAAWAWAFLTERVGLDPERLFVTIYTDDDEAYRVWTDEVGVPPERVSRWGEDENFWPANAVSEGPNGPCGPCSEIFYDRGPEFGSDDETGPNTGSGDRFVEVWNLVFTQYDRKEGGKLEPLPQQNIDTGLGFERFVAVVTGAEDAYATPLFQPTIERVAELSGKPYRGPQSTSHRVIADHLRAVVFAVADGVLPANDGEGYIVKMLLRRAARHAWLLGLREPVLHALVPQVVAAMGSAYPEIATNQERIRGIVRTEESQFLKTLEAGIERVETILADLEERGEDEIPGEVAFDLWETYGFPLDITSEMADAHGVGIDREGFAAARERAREASRGGGGSGELFSASGDALGRIAERTDETRFVGYDRLEADATAVALLDESGDAEVDTLGEGTRGVAILDVTPFYAEGGGQVGDPGKLEWEGGAAAVLRTTKSRQGLYLHEVRVVRGTLEPGRALTARVDPARRDTEKHHTATHLLHAALRAELGDHVAQAGSLVAPDRLRFDLTHPEAIAPEALSRIETMVNRWIQADFEVDWRTVPIGEAREAGAMMLFGEKYGREVRMVTVCDADALPPGPDAVSIELCGGTHVARSGMIGAFAIVDEQAVSAGVRRVEALAGMPAVAYLQDLRGAVAGLSRQLGGAPDELGARVGKLQSDLKEVQRTVQQLRDKLAAAQTSGGATPEAREAGGFTYATQVLEGLDSGALRNAADNLLGKTDADVVVLASGTLMVAKVSDAARERGAHAGNLIRAVAQRAGGGGGGRPDMAQAGAKDPDAVRDALGAVPEILAAS